MPVSLLFISLIAPEPASLPQPFKQDVMHLVKRAKVTSFSNSPLLVASYFVPSHSDGAVCIQAQLWVCLSFLTLYFFLSDVKWELYNVDCKRAADVLRRHPDVHRITGLWFYLCLPVLAVECDMPWKDGLADKYGESFRPWTEEDLLQAVGNVIAALPHNQLATIVSFFFNAHIFLGLSFS